MQLLTRSCGRLALVAAAGIAASAVWVMPAAGRPDDGSNLRTVDDWASGVWREARSGAEPSLLRQLSFLPADAQDADLKRMRASIDLLNTNIQKREADRAAEIAKVSAELQKQLDVPAADPGHDKALSEAIKQAVELYLLTVDKKALMQEPRIKGLIKEADQAAREAEARHDWLTASELFGRLNILLEEEATYRADFLRQQQRLAMIRLYAPEKFWELRNARRVAEGDTPLPPYNPTGDNFKDRLKGVDSLVIRRAIARGAQQHVERVELRPMLVGGIDALRTLASTPEIHGSLTGLADASARQKFMAALERERAAVMTSAAAGDLDALSLVGRLEEANAASVRIPDVALLHEFGNGAMAALDEFSNIIWPDELRQFERTTQGRFIGIGVQIQLDELNNIKVVAPLEDTPAQRAGIRAGDLIKRIDGGSTVGFTLDQAVQVITGPANTQVTVTIERPLENEQKESKDFVLTRSEIKTPTVKGWQKTGARESDWDWFVDRGSGIGYVRLTQFTEATTADFDRAITVMEREGLRGLVLDLRFNPGGLLNQAVSVANRFIEPRANDPLKGVIVSTRRAGGAPGSAERAERGEARLAQVPVVVLINENSASASEIVSGAIQDYAATGAVRGTLVGSRSYGKGSVQNVWDLSNSAAMKLTTQYYVLPRGRMIHRRPGANVWGVEPNLSIEMLPEQSVAALRLRQNADVWVVDEKGTVATTGEPRPNPEDLIAKGMDVQLQTALVVLQSQLLPERSRQALMSK